MSARVISSVYVSNAVNQAHQAGFDLQPMLARIGVEPTQLQSPQGLVTEQQYTQVMLALIRATNDEFFCMGGRRRAPRGSFGMMCHSVIHLPNLRKAILRGTLFYNQLMGDIHIKLRVRGDKATFSLRWDNPELDSRHVTTEAMLTIMHRFPCWLINQRIPLLYASFAYPAPPHVQHYNRLFHCPLHFNQSENSICFNAEYLDSLIMQNETSLRSFLKNAPANLFVVPDNDQVITTRIIALLGKDFTQELPDLEEVADRLYLSSQTLRRRLKEECTSFQEIKDNLRRDAAIYYLSRPQLSISKIAQLMGFSETSTFHRAFKKWTGLTPGEYRQGLD